MRLARATVCRSSTTPTIAFVGIDLLLAPVGEGMGGAGDEHEAVIVGEFDHLAAQVEEVFASFFNGGADVGADFNDGLVHLGLDLFVQAGACRGRASRCRYASAGRG